MTLAHLGVGVFLVGALLVEGLNVQREVAVKPGQTIEVGEYAFRFDGVQQRQGPNYRADYGTVLVFADGIIRWKHVGPMSEATIEQELLPVLAEVEAHNES